MSGRTGIRLDLGPRGLRADGFSTGRCGRIYTHTCKVYIYIYVYIFVYMFCMSGTTSVKLPARFAVEVNFKGWSQKKHVSGLGNQVNDLSEKFLKHMVKVQLQIV